MIKQWKNITELRKIAKGEGITSVHKKDEAQLLEALTQKGVEVSETPSEAPGKMKQGRKPKAEPVAKVEKPEKEAEKETEPVADPEPVKKQAGPLEAKEPQSLAIDDDIEAAQIELAKKSAELAEQQAEYKALLKRREKMNIPERKKTFIELLRESQEHDKGSEAIQKAKQMRQMRIQAGRQIAQQQAMRQQAQTKGK